MDIAEKLQLLRKKQGLSQEELADRLEVSRQAIGKWESGQSCPELDKLVQLSELYGVSLDRIVRGDGECSIRIGNKENISKKEIVEFRIRAFKSCYGGQGKKTESCRKASCDFEYMEDEMYYYDTFLGSEQFVGEEAVWKAGIPLWGMNYCGRVTGEHFSGDFLKEALSAASYDMPYRGPVLFQKGEYTYHCKTDGDFEWFQGYEEILYEGIKIYECHFHGGLTK